MQVLPTLLVFALAVAASGIAAAPWRSEPVHPGPARAVAVAAGGALAVADAEGLRLGSAEPAELFHPLKVPGIRDLAFDGDGGLWAAGEAGLHYVGARSRVATRGAGVPPAFRLARAGDAWLAATADGLRRLAPGGDWLRVGGGLPPGEATALAARADASSDSGRIALGLVVDGRAYWGEFDLGAGAFVPGAEAPLARAVDVAFAPEGLARLTLLEDGCVVSEDGRVVSEDGRAVSDRRACATLPAGARAERLFVSDRGVWLTSQRGTYFATGPEGPWQRAHPPLDTLAVHGLAGGAGAWFAATDRGLHRRAFEHADAAPASPEPAERPALAPAAGAITDLPVRLLGERREPSIEEVRRAALAYLELEPGRLRRLRRGAERRGWLPTLSLRLERDHGTSVTDDRDEAFLSGDTRRLLDFERERQAGFEASLALSWDFGDVLHHPESVDVSREVRELLELRDDVLDELRHLYFERRRVQLELLALPEGRPLEAARLRLRADELGAGIDAWTGGWFGERTAERWSGGPPK